MNNGDYTVVCDYCHAIIGTYACTTINSIPQSNFDLPLTLAGIKVGNRDFCDDYCYRLFKEKYGRFAE